MFETIMSDLRTVIILTVALATLVTLYQLSFRR